MLCRYVRVPNLIGAQYKNIEKMFKCTRRLISFFPVALACISNSIRSIYIGASIAWLERKLGNDISFTIFNSCKSWTHGYKETAMDFDRWKSCFNTMSSNRSRLIGFFSCYHTWLDSRSTVWYLPRAFVMRQCLSYCIHSKLFVELGDGRSYIIIQADKHRSR